MRRNDEPRNNVGGNAKHLCMARASRACNAEMADRGSGARGRRRQCSTSGGDIRHLCSSKCGRYHRARRGPRAVSTEVRCGRENKRLRPVAAVIIGGELRAQCAPLRAGKWRAENQLAPAAVGVGVARPAATPAVWHARRPGRASSFLDVRDGTFRRRGVLASTSFMKIMPRGLCRLRAKICARRRR